MLIQTVILCCVMKKIKQKKNGYSKGVFLIHRFGRRKRHNIGLSIYARPVHRFGMFSITLSFCICCFIFYFRMLLLPLLFSLFFFVFSLHFLSLQSCGSVAVVSDSLIVCIHNEVTSSFLPLFNFIIPLRMFFHNGQIEIRTNINVMLCASMRMEYMCGHIQSISFKHISISVSLCYCSTSLYTYYFFYPVVCALCIRCSFLIILYIFFS